MEWAPGFWIAQVPARFQGAQQKLSRLKKVLRFELAPTEISKKNSVRRLEQRTNPPFFTSPTWEIVMSIFWWTDVFFSPLGWSNSVWVAKCRLLGSLHYPPTKNYRPSQDIHAWNGLQGGNTTVYLDLLLWCLENVKDILLNGGLMVIYHGTKLKQNLKQIQVYSKPHLRNKQLVFLWQEFQEPKKNNFWVWSLQFFASNQHELLVTAQGCWSPYIIEIGS